jgi:integrase
VGYYAREVKASTRWLFRRNRIADDPLSDLPGATTVSDYRHDRRPLSESELHSLLAISLESGEFFRGLTGYGGHHLYLTAMATKFRVGELASLTPASFHLDGNPLTVNLRADQTKNGEPAELPLRSDTAEVIRAYLANKPADQPLWPGKWPNLAAEMLRRDLEDAGIPYILIGPSGPLLADFHSLRHAYVALLDKAGVTVMEAIHPARHSDPKLTMVRYGRPQLHDLAGALERLPALLTTRPGTMGLSPAGTVGVVAEMVAARGDIKCSEVCLSEKQPGQPDQRRTPLTRLQRRHLGRIESN